mgnify:FL=1
MTGLTNSANEGKQRPDALMAAVRPRHVAARGKGVARCA